jgi:hypothetical protein
MQFKHTFVAFCHNMNLPEIFIAIEISFTIVNHIQYCSMIVYSQTYHSMIVFFKLNDHQMIFFQIKSLLNKNIF